MNTNDRWQITIPFLQADVASTPNSRATSNEEKLDDYYQAMFVTFASLARFNPDLPLTLTSNAPLPVRYQEMYSSVGVQTQIIPFTRQPPSHIPQTFVASLYYLDVLPKLGGEHNVVLDPDILCVNGFNFTDGFPRNHLGGIPINYAPTQDVNGLSRAQASLLHSHLGLPPRMPDYYGGEVYVLPSALLPEITDYAEAAWQYTLDAGPGYGSCFYTEEHIMNFVLAHFPVVDLQGSIRRIWTTHRHRTVTGTENKLALWHLPAEKGRGFRDMFSFASRPESWFWRADRQVFVRRSATIMGVTHRRLSRWLPDQLGVAANVLLGPKR